MFCKTSHFLHIGVWAANYFDVPSWCLRFLIKVREFLDKIFKQPSSRSDKQEQDDSTLHNELIQSYLRYRARIDRAVIGGLVWCLKLPMSQPIAPSWNSWRDILRPIGPEVELYGGTRISTISWKYRKSYAYRTLGQDSEDFLFISIVALYVLKFQLTDQSTKSRDIIMNNHWVWNEILESYPHHTSRTDEAKVALLQFLDAMCWQNISSQLLRGQSLADTVTKDLDKLESLKQRAGNLAKMSEKPEPDEYTKEEEGLDRLIFLLIELFPEESSIFKAHTLRRFEGRVSSRTVKPGMPWEEGSSTKISTQAPWELNCLNHHITLRVATQTLGPGSDDIRKVKGVCSRFLAQDLTFIASISRSSPECLEKLWDVCPSAIVCATLLDLDQKYRG